MSTAPIFVDTLFFSPAALTSAGTTSTCIVADQDNAGSNSVGFQVTVASIGINVVVRFEGSLDGTNFFALAASDTTITANGTTGYNFANFPLKAIRGRLVSISTGSPTVTFVMSAK
jgi:hypothetical protein